MKIKEFLRECRSQFQNDGVLRLADEALGNVFCSFQRNDQLAKVFVKVSILNKLYKTNVYNEIRLTKHIAGINCNGSFDSCLSLGGLEAVELIRKGHGIVSKNGNEIDYYSFATKFCHWSNPNHYPIYDSFVDTGIRFMVGTEEEIVAPNFNWGNLKDYVIFKQVIDYFKEVLGFSDLSYKDFDEALWMYGRFVQKKLFPPVQSWLQEISDS